MSVMISSFHRETSFNNCTGITRMDEKRCQSRSSLIIDILRTRETVEASDQPHNQPAHCGPAPTQHLWPGRPDAHPRAHQTHAWEESHEEAAKSEQTCLQMGLCRTAWLPCLQGHTCRQYGGESRCPLQQPGVPQVRAYR